MSARILYGKPVAEQIKQAVLQETSLLGRQLKIVTLGFASNLEWGQYSKSLQKSAPSYNCEVQNNYVDDNVTPEEFFAMLDVFSADQSVDGILVQQPLPKDFRFAIDHINPSKDIDGLTANNLQSLFCAKEVLVPATPLAVVKILQYYGIDMQGKNAVIIGRGIAVGKPLSLLLLNRNATVTVCHTKTVDVASIAKNADLLVSAVGKAGLVTPDFVNQNAVVIDVGLSFENGIASGDVDFEAVSQCCSAISPVPGGVGPVTRACLFYNTLVASKNK